MPRSNILSRHFSLSEQRRLSTLIGHHYVPFHKLHEQEQHELTDIFWSARLRLEGSRLYVDKTLRVDQLSDEEVRSMRRVYAGAAERIGKQGIDWIRVVTLVGIELLQCMKWYEILNLDGARNGQGGRQGGGGQTGGRGGGGLGRRR
jgi:hypothetical protein